MLRRRKPVPFKPFFSLVILAVATLAVSLVPPVIAAEPARPDFAAIAKYVARDFAAKQDYAPGDIISRSEVKPIFAGLRKMGWNVPNPAAIIGRVPKDSDFVVVQLRTPKGRKFMRQVAVLPEGYDRLYRLAAMPLGRQTIHDLVREPGGYEMIQYMTTSQGGVNLGKMLNRTPDGRDFNKPTGMIYTQQALLAELKASYLAETAK